MNRRGFLSTLVGGVAVAAAARSWPFRVYSFPTQPSIWSYPDALFYDNHHYLAWDDVTQQWTLSAELEAELIVQKPLSWCRIEGVSI